MRFTVTPPFALDLYRGLRDLTREPFGLTERLEGKLYQTIILGRLVSVRQQENYGPLVIDFEGNDPDLRLGITREITRRFGLLHDLAAFYKFAENDHRLAPVVRDLEGLTMFQKSSPFEALVTAITDQQLNVAIATTLKRRLITHYGACFTFDDFELRTFPLAERIADLPTNALRPLQYSGSKSRSIVLLARGIVAGDYPLDEWSRLADEDLLKALTSIYGVGRWTAEYAALVGFNRADLVPAADIGLMNAVQRCYGLKERPGEKEVREIAERWRPWRSLVTYYLWHAFE